MHIVIFEILVESVMSCLSELKVTASFCFAFKIPDNVAASNSYPSKVSRTMLERLKPLFAMANTHYTFENLFLMVFNLLWIFIRRPL